MRDPEKNAAYGRRRRAVLITQGLCTTCHTGTPRAGVKTCDACLTRIAAHKRTPSQRAKERVAARRRYAAAVVARRAAGLCVRCGQHAAAENRSMCAACLDYNRNRTGRPGTRGSRENLVCSACGAPGHNAYRHRPLPSAVVARRIGGAP